METNTTANRSQQRNPSNGRGLRNLLIGGMIAATLTMSAGLAVVGTAAAATGAVVGAWAWPTARTRGNRPRRRSGRERRHAARDRPGERARATRGAALPTTQAQHAADRAEAYSGCRQVLAHIDTAWDER